jgi:hypothetical protein
MKENLRSKPRKPPERTVFMKQQRSFQYRHRARAWRARRQSMPKPTT